MCGMQGLVGEFPSIYFPESRLKSCCLFVPPSGTQPRDPSSTCSFAGFGHRQPHLGHWGIPLTTMPLCLPALTCPHSSCQGPWPKQNTEHVMP